MSSHPAFIFMVLLMTSLAYLGTWPHTLRQHVIYGAALAAMVVARDVGLGMDGGGADSIRGVELRPVLLGCGEAEAAALSVLIGSA